MRGWLALLVACGPPAWDDDVAPIVAQRCASSGCHLGPEPTTGLDLSPAVAFDALVGAPSTEAPGVDRVAPGDADGSYLLHKVSGTQATVGSGDPMPPPFGLGAEEVETLTAWVEGGAQR